MSPQEFNNLVGKEISDKEMNVIQTVYTFHPAIHDIAGKEQMAKLYLEFGMTVIYDMLPRAEKLMKLEQERFKAKAEVDRINKEISKAYQWGESL